MHQRFWFIVVILVLAEPNLLVAQDTQQTEAYLEQFARDTLARQLNDRSMEDPTKLSELATTDDARVEVVGTGASIVSRDSTADIAAIKISTSSGEREVGVRIDLAREGESDSVYLDVDQARRILGEFSQFRRQEAPGSECGAINTCYNQPIRCSPMQTMVQAVCGSVYYSVRNQEQGVAFRTPRGEFLFPLVPAGDFYEVFDAVIPMARRARRE
jgi:hypothetical protein